MKIAVNVAAVIVCGTVLFFGQQHWKEKLADHPNAAAESITIASQIESQKEERIHRYTKNLPPFLAEKIRQAEKTGKPLHFVIAGSEATGTAAASWPMLFKTKLEHTYGQDIFAVTVKQYPEMTTASLVSAKAGSQLAGLKPDIILFEPPMIEDNGVIGLQNTLTNLGTLIKGMRGQNNETIIIMQPPNPLYGAKVYPGEIARLQQFAKDSHILYLDHWKAWPAPSSPGLQAYLEQDGIAVNEKGQQLWAGFLSSYFISSE